MPSRATSSRCEFFIDHFNRSSGNPRRVAIAPADQSPRGDSGKVPQTFVTFRPSPCAA